MKIREGSPTCSHELLSPLVSSSRRGTVEALLQVWKEKKHFVKKYFKLLLFCAFDHFLIVFELKKQQQKKQEQN